MQLCIYHEVIVDITSSYSSPINGNLEHPHQTIKNTVCIQILYHGNRYYIWCLCYKYAILIIYCIINRRLRTSNIDACYKQKNIFFTIIFT